ncbi:MAG: UvrD-helicase domain-containing protein [Clostridia bacterium]|nr:UvrD-helicase domain-containing protein [Clostridia bacterium]
MPQWTQDQQQAIDARNPELLISAAAGSGKTAVLIEHVLKMLREGGKITRLLIITFTRAAAAELKERLSKALDTEAPRNPHLREQLLDIRRAEISTLHVFCHNVIRMHFQAADIDPTARISENTQLDPLFQRALGEAMENICAADDEDAVALCSQYQDADIVSMAEQLYHFLRAQQNPWEWLENHLQEDDAHVLQPFMLLLRKECLMRLEGAQQLCRQCEYILTLPGAPAHLDITVEADKMLVDMLTDQARKGTLLNQSMKFPTRARPPKNAEFDPQLLERYSQLRDSMKALVNEAVSMLPENIDEAREEILFTYPALRALARMVRDMHERFQQYKEEKNLLDYGDLEHFALKALADPSVRQQVAARYDAIFVDEYQDVSAIQEAIVRAIHTKENRLFMVGDVKQSIYRFRLADPTLFLSKYEQFEGEEQAVSRRILLSQNFRSRKNILDAVNCVFERAMRRGATEIEYDDKAKLYAGKQTTGDPAVQLHIISDQVEAIDEETDEDDRKGWMYEAQLAAQLIRQYVGTPISTKDGDRPLKYRDCVILLRNASGRAPLIAKILAHEGIPSFSDADGQYFDLPEVRDIMNILRVLDNPLQDIPLLAALRCPCFGFTNKRLAEIRLKDETRQKPFHEVFFALRDSESDVKKACETLDHWRFLSYHLTADALIWQILTESGLYALAGAQKEGSMRQANLRLLYERAQAEGARDSLHDFLCVSDVARHTGDATTARELGENDNVVRIMTMHKSKGLEFSLVIIMELGRNFRMPYDSELLRTDAQTGLALKRCDDVQRITGHTAAGRALACKKERELRSEEARLLYVAMTRAQDRLILLSSPRSLEKSRTIWNLPTGDYAAGCTKNMLDWIGQAVCEGLEIGHDTLFTARNGSEWDLRFHAPGDFRQSLPQSADFIQPDFKGDPHEDVRKRMERIPPKQHALKTSVTALLRGAVLMPDEEETPETKRLALKLNTLPPRFPEFMMEKKLSAADRGTAAHKALGALHLDEIRSTTGAKRIEAIKNQLLRMQESGELTPEEAEVIDISDILTFLTGDLGRRMLSSPRVEREWGFCLMYRGVLVQGVPDLCFMEDGKWVLVDYKTDRCEPEKLLTMYRDQILWYKKALWEITGIDVKEVWLYSLRNGVPVRVE